MNPGPELLAEFKYSCPPSAGLNAVGLVALGFYDSINKVFSGLSQTATDTLRLRANEVLMNERPVVTWRLLKTQAKHCSNLSIRMVYHLEHGTLAYKETTLAVCLACLAKSLDCENLEEASQRLNIAWADRGQFVDFKGLRVKLSEINLNGTLIGYDPFGREVIIVG